MSSLAPQVGDSANLLLTKLVLATQALVASGVTIQMFEDAPQDGNNYVRKNGSWVQVADPIVDGIVQTYENLPVDIGSPALEDVYLVMEATGVYFVSRHPAGLYVRTAMNGELADWTYAATLTDSEQ